MSDDSTHTEDESTYPEIELPTFKSDIPAPLLAGSTEEARYILENLSMLTQYVKWSAPVLIAINEQTRKTNGRVIRLESWRAMFSNWWVLILGAATIGGGIAGLVEAWSWLTRP